MKNGIVKVFAFCFCAIMVGITSVIAGDSVGASNSVCSNPKQDGVVWYMDSPTTAGWLDKGQVYEGVIEACNDNTESRSITLSTAPYSIAQDDYTGMNFIDKTAWNKLADWISFPNGDKYTINSGGTIYIPFKITVPNNDQVIAGSQAASIMLEDDEVYGDQEGSTVLSTKRFAWVVYADINGDGLRESGQVVDWRADGLFVFDNSKGINTRSLVENTGNVSFKAQYKLYITDLFRNNAVAYETDAERTILPESKSANEFKWNEAPAVGIFNIKEEITVYGKTETFEKMVLIVPLWFVIIVIAVVLLLIWALILKIKQHREKNKRLKS